MKKVFFIFFLGLVALVNLSFSQSLQASGKSSIEASGQSTAALSLQKKLEQMQGVQADFKQEVRANRRQISTSSGNFALSRPGRFRWSTDAPLSQLIVADGKKIWIYDIELEQVTVKPQTKELGGMAALFLSADEKRLAKDFKVEMLSQGANESFLLTAKSKKESFKKVKLIYQASLLTAIELWDQLAQHTVIHLSKIALNPHFASHFFEFIPPKGVDLIEDKEERQ